MRRMATGPSGVNGINVPAAGAAVATTSVFALTSSYVTTAVQNWIGGVTPNNGFLIQANSSTDVHFDSKESMTTSQPAMLSIVLASSGWPGPAGSDGPPRFDWSGRSAGRRRAADGGRGWSARSYRAARRCRSQPVRRALRELPERGGYGSAGVAGATGPQGVCRGGRAAGCRGRCWGARSYWSAGVAGATGPQGAVAGATGPQGLAGATGHVGRASRAAGFDGSGRSSGPGGCERCQRCGSSGPPVRAGPPGPSSGGNGLLVSSLRSSGRHAAAGFGAAVTLIPATPGVVNFPSRIMVQQNNAFITLPMRQQVYFAWGTFTHPFPRTAQASLGIGRRPNIWMTWLSLRR